MRDRVKFIKAKLDNIESIITVINHGQEFLKEQGVNQWQNNYPNEQIIKTDIDKGYAYIVEEKNQIVGTVALSFDGEITYDQIYDGEWLTDYDYCVIHRMAIHRDKRGRGISVFMMNSIELLCRSRGIKSIKVDTHRNNIPMQQYLKRCGFKYCGIIYLLDGDERLAFEKIL